jgi:hypothetical protein
MAACKTENVVPAAVSFEQNSGIDLERFTFRENVPLLYAKHLLNTTDVDYDSARDGALNDSMLAYRISNIITESMDLHLPVKEFGYCYRSPEMDSMARFGKGWFFQVNTLTDLHKKPVAYYARGHYDQKKDRKAFLDSFRKQYGPAQYAFKAKESPTWVWQLKDRTIEISTFNGFEAEFTNKGNTSRDIYYVDMLIVDNTVKDALYQAHVYEFPDKIWFHDKWHSYKDFQFEKRSVFSDNFLLSSSYKDLLENKDGLYSLSEEDEE